MWCPKCKLEYQDGITICADCGTELVESIALPDGVDICELMDEAMLDEVMDFLAYSGIKEMAKEPLDDNDGFRLVVDKKEAKKAERLFKGYMMAKAEEKENEEADLVENAVEENTTTEETFTDASSLEEEFEESDKNAANEEEVGRFALDDEELRVNPLLVDEIDENSSDLLHTKDKKEFVKMSDRYKDILFSGITFIVFGVIGFVYLVLCKEGIIPMSYTDFVLYVLVGMFAIFLVIGVVSIAKAFGLKKKIPAEEKRMEEINTWLEENITSETLDGWKDASVSDMENDLILSAHICTALMKEFPEENVSFLSFLADAFYEEKFVEE